MEMPSPERIRVAQELHDGIAQDLVGIGYSLDLLLSEQTLSNNARSEIRRTRFAIDELIGKVRSEILNLRKISSEPLGYRVQALIAEVAIGFQLDLAIEDVPLPQMHHAELLAITSEILRNCIHHSGASHLGIKLYSVNNQTCLEVIDNGIGGAHVKDGHFGISGIIERVSALGGSITIESIDGTRVAILI